MTLNKREMQYLFKQMLKYSDKLPVTLGIYRFEDINYIASELTKYGKPKYKNISIEWQIGNLTVAYFPESIVTAEEFAIDANGVHFLPFGGDHHLADRPEKWQINNDLIITDPDKSYENIVDKYWQHLGCKVFKKEVRTFKNLL
jgi:hypothetical protein